MSNGFHQGDKRRFGTPSTLAPFGVKTGGVSATAHHKIMLDGTEKMLWCSENKIEIKIRVILF